MPNDQITARPSHKVPYMSRTQRQRVSEAIAARIEELGENPWRPISENWDPETGRYPYPRNRMIFPPVAYSRAGRHTRLFTQAFNKGADTNENLRLVTLRVGDQKPVAGDLDAHLREISKTVNSAFSYLIKQGVAHPQLSAIHIRRDPMTGRLDPHLHGLWKIDISLIARARELLEKHFTGVWIDTDPPRNLSRLTFYLCSGVFDYRDIPTWPTHLIKEVWQIRNKFRFIRPSGEFLAYKQQIRISYSHKRIASVQKNPTHIGQSAPVARNQDHQPNPSNHNAPSTLSSTASPTAPDSNSIQPASTARSNQSPYARISLILLTIGSEK